LENQVRARGEQEITSLSAISQVGIEVEGIGRSINPVEAA
jgi:hypothetical protein